MINFRYHLISFIAVFLALGVGLLVGATYLSGPAETLLKQQQENATTQNDTLRARNAQLTQQLAAYQAFAQADSQRLLTGLLAGERVALVQAPGVSSQMTAGVIAALQESGALITEKVEIQPDFLASSGVAESNLIDLSRRSASAEGIGLPASPLYSGAAGQQDASAVIAAGFVSTDGDRVPTRIDQAILDGFVQAGFLQVNAPVSANSATLAVLLTASGAEPQSVSQELASVAAELKSAGLGAVMAGALSPAGATNALTLVAAAGTIPTVDNTHTEIEELQRAGCQHPQR